MLANLRIKSNTFFTRALCSFVFQPAENVKNSPQDGRQVKDCKKTHLLGIRYEIERLQTLNSLKKLSLTLDFNQAIQVLK